MGDSIANSADYPWPMIVTAVGVIMGTMVTLGTIAVRWILGEVSRGDQRAQDAHTTMKEKIEAETKTIGDKVDHKHNNVDAQFQGIQAFLDRLTDKIETLTKDNVLLNERMRGQETSVREFKTEVKEFKTEMKESFRALGSSIDAHLKEISSNQATQFAQLASAQTTQFNQIAANMREIHALRPKS